MPSCYHFDNHCVQAIVVFVFVVNIIHTADDYHAFANHK